MSVFLDDLVLTKEPHGKWLLHERLRYLSATTQGLIVVPAGFETDGASVPRILWNALPPVEGDYAAAAVLHDYLYQFPNRLNRAGCDAVFREAMDVLGVNWLTRWAMWSAVRAGGWKPWNAYRAREAVRA